MRSKAAVVEAYEVAKRIRDGSLTRAAGMEELHQRFGMNRNSAKGTFVNIGHMLKGETYKRKMNAIETAHFLEMIHRDYGRDALRKAIASVEKHIHYYEGLPKGKKLLNIWEIVHKYRDIANAELEESTNDESRLGRPNADVDDAPPNTFLLEWNPRYYPWYRIKTELADAHRRGIGAIPWDVGGNKDLRTGDRVFVMRVQNNQGIIGRGRVTSLPEDGRHWREDKAAKGETYTFVMITLDQLLEHPVITWTELKDPPFSGYNWTPRRSGRPIPEQFAIALNSRWTAITGQCTLPEDLTSIAQQNIDSTVKQALINARIGQGRYRTQVLRLWGNACSVTGSVTQAAIRASHIKSWRESTNDERLDPHNGLPLVASLDALFDAGLISFGSTGELIVSAELTSAERQIYGVGEKSLTKAPTAKTAVYLSYHRRKHGFRE